MSRPKPVIRKLCDLQNGQIADFFALLCERGKSTTRDGKPFYACKFRDARRTVSYMVWADNERYAECEAGWQPGMFFKVRATYEDHRQFGPRIEVHNLRIVNDQDRADGFVEADLLDRSRRDPAEMLAELRDLAETAIADEPLRRLTLLLLDSRAEELKSLPGSTRHYYPFAGGWLEHTLSVAGKCLWLVERFREQYADATPPLNRDLVVAAAVLHEIGRTIELEPPREPGEPARKTVPGELFGHITLGRDMVHEAAAQIPELNPEILRLLEHTILTHLAQPEWGSPRLPLIPEALILHYANDLDARMEMFMRLLRKDAAPGPFTERDPGLGRRLLKGRQV